MFRTVPFNLRERMDKGQELVERFLEFAADQPGNPIGRMSGALSSFRVDVIDTASSYELFAELPGFRKEQITVSYDEGGYLHIKAEREELEPDDVRYICHERKAGEFERTFKVDEIDEAGVSVAYENGVLHIVMPKLLDVKNSKVFDIN